MVNFRETYNTNNSYSNQIEGYPNGAPPAYDSVSPCTHDPKLQALQDRLSKIDLKKLREDDDFYIGMVLLSITIIGLIVVIPWAIDNYQMNNFWKKYDKITDLNERLKALQERKANNFFDNVYLTVETARTYIFLSKVKEAAKEVDITDRHTVLFFKVKGLIFEHIGHFNHAKECYYNSISQQDEHELRTKIHKMEVTIEQYNRAKDKALNSKDSAFLDFLAAAEKGYVQAKYSLAFYFYNGNDVQGDKGKAADLWEEAAYAEEARKGGMEQSFVELAECYEKGIGREINLVKAKELYEKAWDYSWLANRALEGLARTRELLKNLQSSSQLKTDIKNFMELHADQKKVQTGQLIEKFKQQIDQAADIDAAVAIAALAPEECKKAVATIVANYHSTSF